MEKIRDILNTIGHRQYPLPEKPWKQYQQWHRNLLLHWKVEASALRALLPEGLSLDTIYGQAWVSMIAFSVKKLRPRFLPAIPLVSDFHEVNFRTYVVRDGIPGIYFLSIEAQKILPVLLARLFIGLPYVKSNIERKRWLYLSRNKTRGFSLSAGFKVGPVLEARSELDYWLTERHALYKEHGSKLHRIDVHHRPWPLQQMDIDARISGYPLIGSPVADLPDLVHYAQELTVLVWGAESI
jgi:uncharacterized protein YqjF (DUF2071 family)